MNTSVLNSICIDHIKKNIEESISNIKKKNSTLNAFVRVYEDDVQKQFEAIRKKIDNGQPTGKLCGMIVGLKDLICYKDHPVQAASKILDGFVSTFSATAVERILGEDALIIGHQNCDEFGMGSSNEHSIYGPVRNGLDINKVPGGSSGGSAVAVQQDMCHVSLGTDTGGSIRQPAAFCGVIGFKPSYGIISRHGMIAYASSFDTMGIIGKNIENVRSVFEVISGPDEFDCTAYNEKFVDCKHIDKQKFKIAYLKNAVNYEGLQKEIYDALLNVFDTLRSNDNEVLGITLDFLQYCLPVYYTLTTAEASSNLARYDGVRYGYKPKEYKNIDELMCKARTEGFGLEVKKRILLGNYVLESGYYEKAKKLRYYIIKKMNDVFDEYDFLLLPTTPTTAFGFNHNMDSSQMCYADIFTTLASIAQLPAISIPWEQDGKNMPIGIQIITKKYNESMLLNFADYLLKTYNSS